MVKIWKKHGKNGIFHDKFMNTKWTLNELKMNWTWPKIWAIITHVCELKISQNMSQIHELNWTEMIGNLVYFFLSVVIMNIGRYCFTAIVGLLLLWLSGGKIQQNTYVVQWGISMLVLMYLPAIAIYSMAADFFAKIVHHILVHIGGM